MKLLIGIILIGIAVISASLLIPTLETQSKDLKVSYINQEPKVFENVDKIELVSTGIHSDAYDFYINGRIIPVNFVVNVEEINK